MSSGTWWGFAIVGLVVGVPLLLFPRQVSGWNRRTSRTMGYAVPEESSPRQGPWGARYTRILGTVCAVVGLVCLIFALTSG
ncbi:hypothetical protein GIS00_22385 [Nakamurella sp. YIM 132087]|uniref:DUF6199 domain-containing protein n=1 Tax=Nakamurella alba TaxID=2665158 RepID=A0A7K1FRB3_9ACTN|nr:hypothetical protein [Nakamurella alba]MTD16688.1 hypothetical protein [Nakamurella alba]